MTFIDFQYYPIAFCFFGALALVQHLLKNRADLSGRWTKGLLLAFSYLTMGMYDIRFCLCMAVVTLLTYCAGRAIARAAGKSKHTLTVLAATALLALLGVFKYLNFFMTTLYNAAGRTWTELHIILPLGISFYIFSALGYILDVAWGNLQAENSLLDMALFLAFFPKQVCGPIVNARDFLPQLKEDRRITRAGVETGIQIFLFGMFKKIVLADHLSVFVNGVYFAPAAYGTATVWLAVFSYFLQLYFDFSGYSDMAVGVSRILGYDIRRNFNLPFIATTISGFWNRWHISLTSWLNTYLFNPVALKLKRAVARWPKKYRKTFKNLPNYTAVMITFLVSGLWHGAGFTFLLFGLFHGLFSVLQSIYANWMKKHCRGFVQNKGMAIRVLDIFANYILVNLIQVLFRADSVPQALFILRRMFTVNDGIEYFCSWSFFAAAMLLMATLAACRRAKKQGLDEVEGYYPIFDLGTVRGLTCFFVLFGLTVMLAYTGENYFAYAEF